MRIIAGNFKGKKLLSPKTEKTRPTLDRVKEAIFSSINQYIEDATVLDLFAGSGALGLEAMSRGAKTCIFNELDRSAFSTCFSNIQLTNMEKYVKIYMKDYIKCLNGLKENNILCDIIFLDPPYNKDYGYKTLKYISDNCNKILSKIGIIIFEIDKSFLDEKYDNLENLTCIATKTYGRVAVKTYKWR
jgi:16S rRNA (guanine966-N2)-methyltransferase